MTRSLALVCLSIVLCTVGFSQPVTVTFQQGTNGYTACRSANISDWNLAPIGQSGDNGTTYGDGVNDWLIGQLHGHPSFGFDISPLLRFDSLGIPPNVRVISASLTVRLMAYEGGARVIGRYLSRAWNHNFSDPNGGVTNAPVGWRWNDRTIDAMWNTLGALGEGTDVVAGKQFTIPESGTFPPTGEQLFTIPLDSAVVQQWINTPSANYGVKLQVDIQNLNVGYVQPQRATTPDRHPLLSITYEPPASVGEPEQPTAFHLSQNYPNPFNPTTTIAYDLPKSSEVFLAVYDLLGRQVVVLVQGVQDAGRHEHLFDASHLGTGVYFFRLRNLGAVQSGKMILLK